MHVVMSDGACEGLLMLPGAVYERHKLGLWSTSVPLFTLGIAIATTVGVVNMQNTPESLAKE